MEIENVKLNEEVEKRKPVKNFMSGKVKASIWVNKSVKDNVVTHYYSYNIDKNYKVDEEWKTTNSFNKSDMGDLLVVINMVVVWIKSNPLIN